MSEHIMQLIKTGDYAEAKKYFEQDATLDINYIDPKSQYSVLMRAISTAETKSTGAADFIEYILKRPDFRLVRDYNSNIKETEFQMAITTVSAEIVQLLVDYHRAHNDLAHCVFARENNLLNYEVVEKLRKSTNTHYHAACDNQNEKKMTILKNRYDRLDAVNDNVLYEISMRYALATDDASIVERLDQAGEITSRSFADGSQPYYLALEQNKPNLLAWYDNKMANLFKPKTDSRDRLFATAAKAADSAQSLLNQRHEIHTQHTTNVASILSKMSI